MKKLRTVLGRVNLENYFASKSSKHAITLGVLSGQTMISSYTECPIGCWDGYKINVAKGSEISVLKAQVC